MKKRFKKIYLEITNYCNLNCSFCSEIKKKRKEMTIEEFEIVISKIRDYTDYIYLHIKGEPLIHSKLDDLLSITDSNNIYVNITTNGTLLKEKYNILNSHKSIRQINISLHSENKLNNYFDNIFEVSKLLSTKMFINYRIWTLNNYNFDKESTKIVNKIKEFYNLPTDIVDKLKISKNIKVDNNIFVNINNYFIWPDINLNYNIDAKCYGLIDQLGILSDGTIVPCCLDSNGIIKLGNIFNDELSDILNSNLVKEIINNFKNNKSYHLLCKNCNFRKRFIK